MIGSAFGLGELGDRNAFVAPRLPEEISKKEGKAMNRTLFILGGTGFIGYETIIQALKAGWQVKALARSEEGAKKMQQMGAQPVLGDMH
jgi:NADPH:quinone reductase-like Zn-dependent oxidoreductase